MSSPASSRSRVAKPFDFWSATLTHEQVFELLIYALAVGTAFFNLSNFLPDKDVTGLDKFVLIKLALTGTCGLVGLYGLFAVPRVQTLLLSLPGLWLTGIASLYVIASFLSPIPLESFASTIAFWCMLLFTTTATVILGPRRLVTAILIGIALFITVSWIAWLFFPSLGVYAEALADDEFSMRMAGISHPNSLGQHAALGAGLTFVLMQNGVIRNRLFLILIPLCLGALILSISRASSIALVVALLFVYRDRIIGFLGPVNLLLVSLFVVGGLLVFSAQNDLGDLISERVLASMAKSGDTTELTSLTGRTIIWGYAIHRLSERPWLGFGPATSKLILVDYVKYTHNLWLNVAFASGIAGLLCMLGLTIGRVWAAFVSPQRIADFIITILFVNGLVENVVFAFTPGAPTMLLVVAVLWRSNDAISRQERGRP